MMLTNKKTLVRLAALAVGAAVLPACGGQHDDLRAYIDEIKTRPGGRIEPLPQIQPAPKFLYEPANRRSPFLPDAPQQRAGRGPGTVEGPDPNRPREPLEQYPLDTFSMVGTMAAADGSGVYGLVRDNTTKIHRVSIGNHMGLNFGRITAITDSEIQLVEIIPDNNGGYLERAASIGLAD